MRCFRLSILVNGRTEHFRRSLRNAQWDLRVVLEGQCRMSCAEAGEYEEDEQTEHLELFE